MPVQWMNEHSELRTMIEEGKDKLEWYRQVDPAKLNTLKELMMQDNYKENMSTLIKTLYEFAFMTYSGIFHMSQYCNLCCEAQARVRQGWARDGP